MDLRISQGITIGGTILCFGSIVAISLFQIPLFPEAIGIFILGWTLTFIGGIHLPVQNPEDDGL